MMKLPADQTKTEPRWKFSEWIPFLCIFAVYLTGMFVDVMEMDAAQYAHISRTLAEGGSWLEFFDMGRPYLDKPPLTFWLTALSFKAFGASNFTYHLPSVCFSILAIYFLYKTVYVWSGHRAAWFSALILASCQAFFLMNLDVKTDMLLIGGILLCLWQFSEFLQNPQWKFAFGAGLGVGLALLAKGPAGAVIPGLALGTHVFFTNTWKAVFNPKILFIPLIGLLLLLPMCIGLYAQFGKEGIEFFFWTQSFGRITGESEWKNSAGPFFLVQSFAWAFLPWTGLFLFALFSKIKSILTGFRRSIETAEWISIAGFILGFFILTLSQFKLPHYIFVVAPFAAWILGQWLDELEKGIKNISIGWIWVHAFVLFASTLVPVIAAYYSFPDESLFPWLGFLALAIVLALSMGLEPAKAGKIVIATVMVATTGNFLLNARVYPLLLNYQANSYVTKLLPTYSIPENRFAVFLKGGRSTAFYLHSNTIPALRDISQADLFLQTGPGYILTNEKGMKELGELKVNIEILKELEDFYVSRLNMKFLNPKTRSEAVKKCFLIRASLIPPGY